MSKYDGPSYLNNDEPKFRPIKEDPKAQHLGIGRLLMRSAHEDPVHEGLESIVLNVRVSNRQAFNLYKSLDYHIVRVQEGYYNRPKEDGYYMQKILNKRSFTMNHIIYIEFTHTDDTTKVMQADEFTGITLSGITEKHSSSFKTTDPNLPPNHNPKIVNVSYSAKTLDMSMPYTVDMFLYFTRSKPINKITIAYSGGSTKTYALSVPNLQLDNDFSPFQTLFVYDVPEKLKDHFLTLTIHPFDEKEIIQFPVRHITSYVQRFPGDNRSDDGMPVEPFDYDGYDDDDPNDWDDLEWTFDN